MLRIRNASFGIEIDPSILWKIIQDQQLCYDIDPFNVPFSNPFPENKDKKKLLFLPIPQIIQALFRSDLIAQIAQRGLTLGISPDISMSLGIVGASQKGRPETSQDFRLLFYSKDLNKATSSFLSIGTWSPAILLSAGMLATYQTEKADTDKMARLFFAACTDAGRHLNGIIIHSCIGTPFYLSSSGKSSPHWEMGIVKTGYGTNPLSFGFSYATSLIGPTPYFGASISKSF